MSTRWHLKVCIDMRIAIIAIKGMPKGGGIEKLTEEIGSRLVTLDHEVIVYTSRDFGTTDCNYCGMRVKTVPSINTKIFHKLSICCFATFDMLISENVDIVHYHAVGPSIFSFIPRIFGIPTVVQAHGLEWKRDKWGAIAKFLFRLAEYTAIYFPNATTAVSIVQKSYYEKMFSRTVTYIPTGVSMPKRHEPDWILEQGLVPRRYILFAARLVEEKGAHFLIEAFRSIKTDMKLVIAGDAAHSHSYQDSLRDMAKLDQRVMFTGFLTGKPLEELFGHAYLFCLPSTIEGLPIALLEAMSYGNCCVASDIPENLEALGGHGYTFENRNSSSLKILLQSLLDDSDLVDAKRHVAQEYVLRNFSWDMIARQMEALYLSVKN